MKGNSQVRLLLVLKGVPKIVFVAVAVMFFARLWF